MPTMDEIAAQYQQQQSPSMDDIAAQYQQQKIGDIPAGQNVLPPPEDMSGATGYEATGFGQWKQIPSFLKKIENIFSGGAEATMNITSALLNQPGNMVRDALKGTFLEDKNDKGDNLITDAQKYWTEKNAQDAEKYAGIGKYQAVGSLIPNIVAFSPIVKGTSLLGQGIEAAGTALKGTGILGTKTAGNVLETIGKGSESIGAALPKKLSTLGEYGAEGVKGAAQLGLFEAAKVPPEDRYQTFLNTVTDPVALGTSILGHGVANYIKNAQALDAAKEIIPKIMSIQLKPKGAARTLEMMTFGALPALLGSGKLPRQLDEMGDVLGQWISKVAGGISSGKYPDVIKKAGQYVRQAGRRIEIQEDVAWQKGGMLQKDIVNTDEVKKQISTAVDLIKGKQLTGESLILDNLNTILNKTKMTVEDAKQANSFLSQAKMSALNPDLHGAGTGLADTINQIRKNILDNIQQSIGKDAMKDFVTASQITAAKYKLFENVSNFQQAITDQVSAEKLIDSLIGPSKSFNKQALLNAMSDKGKDVVGAAFLAKAVKSADESGKFNITTFIKNTNPVYSQAKELLNNDTYKALQGINEYLLAAQEYRGVGWWRQALMVGSGAAALGSSALAGGILGGPVGAGAAMASYLAANFAANHSPLKTIFSALVKVAAKSPRVVGKPPVEPSSIYKHLINKVNDYLGKAGYTIINGVLQHKDEVDINSQPSKEDNE